MQRRDFLKLSMLAPLALSTRALGRIPSIDDSLAAHDLKPDGHPHHFSFHQRHFTLDGHPIQIRSGQMDLIRIPRVHWRQRIRTARAMGLNTISSYLMWNAMEREPGHFDLTTGRRDFVRFIETCAEEGMWVYLRPGPFVGAEWDFGGLPAWLLRNPAMRVRDGHNQPYMQAVTHYFAAIAPHLKPLMVSQGGPVLMLQLENEYASFGHDLAYLEALRSLWLKHGIEGPFSISDGLPQLKKEQTYVPGVALGLDGGTDFAAAQIIAGEAPVWVGEGYTGWLSHWGDNHFQHADYAPTLQKLMTSGRSFNLYEINGGTNFGFGAGANSHNDGSHFQPVITSYDYGAPINERGVVTDEYHRCRDVIAGAVSEKLPPVPKPTPVGLFREVLARPWTSVWQHLPSPKHVAQPRCNEQLFGQNQGMVLYRTHVQLGKRRVLRIDGVHDYATIFLDGQYVGTISHVYVKGHTNHNTLTLPASAKPDARLDILIDSFGHVGYGQYMRDGKGLVGNAYLDSWVLKDWQVFAVPLDEAYLKTLHASTGAGKQQGMFFRADIELPQAGDCYVDVSAWDKGYLWVNGHLLGRYWHIGPQQRLYCPVSFWRQGHNDILVFDMHRLEPAPVRGVATLHD